MAFHKSEFPYLSFHRAESTYYIRMVVGIASIWNGGSSFDYSSVLHQFPRNVDEVRHAPTLICITLLRFAIPSVHFHKAHEALHFCYITIRIYFKVNRVIGRLIYLKFGCPDCPNSQRNRAINKTTCRRALVGSHSLVKPRNGDNEKQYAYTDDCCYQINNLQAHSRSSQLSCPSWRSGQFYRNHARQVP